jgi:ferric-dicitrate binding protein FerR (iron transport regulator)
MTGLVQRLRAANPVRTRNPPAIEDVWRKLEHSAQDPGRDTPRHGRNRGFSKARRRVRHVGLAVSVAVSVLVAALAIVLLGRDQSRPRVSQSRPGHLRPPPSTSRADAMPSWIIAALARGVHPPAPDAWMRLPILGSSRTRSLRSFRGKIVVLNVFASWCDLTGK